MSYQEPIPPVRSHVPLIGIGSISALLLAMVGVFFYFNFLSPHVLISVKGYKVTAPRKWNIYKPLNTANTSSMPINFDIVYDTSVYSAQNIEKIILKEGTSPSSYLIKPGLVIIYSYKDSEYKNLPSINISSAIKVAKGVPLGEKVTVHNEDYSALFTKKNGIITCFQQIGSIAHMTTATRVDKPFQEAEFLTIMQSTKAL